MRYSRSPRPPERPVSLTLFHHPHSRAANVVWMLEEVGAPYTLSYVDLKKGQQHQDPHHARNRMGKVPVLDDDGVLVSETAAIGLYLADRYASGRLAPALDDPARGPFLRWCFYPAAVIEPACAAKAAGWEYRASAVGWGRYEDVVATLEQDLADGPWLLGDRFTIADVILGGTVTWMVQFKMLDAKPVFTEYMARLAARPAKQRSDEINARVAAEHAGD